MLTRLERPCPGALSVSGLILATLLSGASTGPASNPQRISPVRQSRLMENYGKLPLSFEANNGQTIAAVKFLSHTRGYTLFLTRAGAVLEVQESGVGSQKLTDTLRLRSCPRFLGSSG